MNMTVEKTCGDYKHTFPLDLGTDASDKALIAQLVLHDACKGLPKDTKLIIGTDGEVHAVTVEARILSEQDLEDRSIKIREVVQENLEFAKSLDRIASAIADWRKAQQQ